MEYYTKDGALIAELRGELAPIRTVGEFSEYLRTFRSLVVSDCLLSAIAYFSKDCHKSDGKLDWKAVKERGRLGLKFQLTLEHEITPEIVNALWAWLCAPSKGRDLGTSFSENLLSVQTTGISFPRYVAFDMLKLLHEKFAH